MKFEKFIASLAPILILMGVLQYCKLQREWRELSRKGVYVKAVIEDMRFHSSSGRVWVKFVYKSKIYHVNDAIGNIKCNISDSVWVKILPEDPGNKFGVIGFSHDTLVFEYKYGIRDSLKN